MLNRGRLHICIRLTIGGLDLLLIPYDPDHVQATAYQRGSPRQKHIITSINEMSTITSTVDEWVHYHDGGVPGRRRVLTGAAAKATFNELPKIDFRRIYSDKVSDRQSLAKEVGEACRNVGFFYAVNHGVAESLLDDTFEATRRFFELPKEVKIEVHNQKSPKFRGYMRDIDLSSTRMLIYLQIRRIPRRQAGP